MRTLGTLFITSTLLAWLAGCATAPSLPPAASAELGESKISAIEVCMPTGQRAYIASLICSSGRPPEYRRIGSVGPRTDYPSGLSKEQENARFSKTLSGQPLAQGEADHHVIDSYELSCGNEKRTLYFDMYHCNRPKTPAAPRGFTLKGAGG